MSNFVSLGGLMMSVLVGGWANPATVPPPSANEIAVVPDEPCPPAAQMEAFGNDPVALTFKADLARWTGYPREAVGSGQAGEVVLCVKIDGGGDVMRARVLSSSGFPALDGAALRALGWAEDHRHVDISLPDGMREAWLAVPVKFMPPDSASVAAKYSVPGPCSGLPEPKQAAADGAAPHEFKFDTGAGLQFRQALRGAIHGQFQNIEHARSSRMAKATTMCVSVGRDSRIIDAAVVRSSGSPALDGTALMAVASLQIRGTPPALPDEALVTSVTAFRFQLPINWTGPGTEMHQGSDSP